MSNVFWERLDELVGSSRIIVDRPRGSRHPNFPSAVYPLDYGYLENTTGGDGHEIDVWSGSSASKVLDAVLCTVDLHKRDAELKLLIGCTEEEKRLVYDFHTTASSAAVFVERH
jgi:inorganic pyrophosphatase